MSARHWRFFRLLVFGVWVIYFVIFVINVAIDDWFRSMYPFWISMLLGLVAAVSALRNSIRWPVWVSLAALLNFSLLTYLHVYFILGALHHKPCLAAALEHYLLLNTHILQHLFTTGELLYFFTKLYGQWIMPVLQIFILIFSILAWWHLRSNPAFKRDALKRAP